MDTDNYPSQIHFPFFATDVEGVRVIERGTPLVQVIPFRRADPALNGVVRAQTGAEVEATRRVLRQTDAGDGWYRKEARAAR